MPAIVAQSGERRDYAGARMNGSSGLVLGSASPRRRALLEGLGIAVEVAAADVDEARLADETPERYLERIVVAKLGAVARSAYGQQGRPLLVADTIVLLADRILGKPVDLRDAEQMLTALSSRSHEVRTRFAIGRVREPGEPPEVLHAETVTTAVWFRMLDPQEIARYAATGEGLDKAGAYAIQGIGSFAVCRIEGSYSNVVGLPVCETVVALKRLGLLGPFP